MPVRPYDLGPPLAPGPLPAAIRRFARRFSRSCLESTPPSDPLLARRFRPVVPRARGARARALARARHLQRVDPPPRGGAPLRLLRGSADRQREAGRAPRPLARLQGRL